MSIKIAEKVKFTTNQNKHENSSYKFRSESLKSSHILTNNYPRDFQQTLFLSKSHIAYKMK